MGARSALPAAEHLDQEQRDHDPNHNSDPDQQLDGSRNHAGQKHPAPPYLVTAAASHSLPGLVIPFRAAAQTGGTSAGGQPSAARRNRSSRPVQPPSEPKMSRISPLRAP